MKLSEKEKQQIVNEEMEELKQLLQTKKISKAEMNRWKKAGVKETLEQILKLFHLHQMYKFLD